MALAAVGLFGVMATMVKQRAREIGVRMALGATRADVFREVMRRGLAIALIGAAVGTLASLASNRLLIALLYDLSPTDMPTYLAVLGLLFTVSAAAVAVPARSSTRVDPVLALRAEWTRRLASAVPRTSILGANTPGYRSAGPTRGS